MHLPGPALMSLILLPVTWCLSSVALLALLLVRRLVPHRHEAGPPVARVTPALPELALVPQARPTSAKRE